ncbi:MAG: TetR/AcrR family transcriptional regulator [Paludibacter sp.]
MQEIPEKKRRNRRSKQTIEREVLNAVSSLIEEVGFANVTLTGVAQRAQIEATVFYRRYANLEELFDQYTRKYDYWLGNLAELMPTDLNDEESFKWILQNLIIALYKNKGMQELLIWELSNNNAVTRRTATLRELVNEPLIRLLEYRFKDSGIDMNVICALIISGIYYLILHRNISRFCDVDFSTKKGKDRLNSAVNQLVSILFSELKRQQQLLEIADKLRAEGISEDIINKCFYQSKQNLPFS